MPRSSAATSCSEKSRGRASRAGSRTFELRDAARNTAVPRSRATFTAFCCVSSREAQSDADSSLSLPPKSDRSAAPSRPNLVANSFVRALSGSVSSLARAAVGTNEWLYVGVAEADRFEAVARGSERFGRNHYTLRALPPLLTASLTLRGDPIAENAIVKFCDSQ